MEGDQGPAEHHFRPETGVSCFNVGVFGQLHLAGQGAELW